MNTQETKELLNSVITNLESPQPQQWQPSWIEELRSIQNISDDNQRLKRALEKIVEAGDVWGSEGKQHHEALYIARCALAEITR